MLLFYIVGWKNVDPKSLEEMELNGTREQPRKHTITGETHRLRLMNIAPAGLVKIKMLKNGQPVPIKLVAKDGNDMPEIQQVLLEES